jgi:UDP-N-acetylmuramate-alanine ligase
MKIYLLGIAGTGMGSFAGLLRAAGHEVSGSDENVYPPMSDKLAEWRIQSYTPYSATNLDKAKPDLAVVGNVIRAENPEAKAVRRKGVPHMSFPETLEDLFLTTRHPVVVAGTHGKTTSTSLLAAVLHHAGRDPSLLVGGVPLNFNEGFRLGKGEHFVIEGDEYDTAYFDKGPKFLHYRPRTAIVTGAEFDHADIYRDTPHYESAFEKFYAILPPDGYVAACSLPTGNGSRHLRNAKSRRTAPTREERALPATGGGRRPEQTATRRTGPRAGSPWGRPAPLSRSPSAAPSRCGSRFPRRAATTWRTLSGSTPPAAPSASSPTRSPPDSPPSRASSAGRNYAAK